MGHTSLDQPGLFQWTFGLSSSIGFVILILYHAIGKTHEKRLVAEKKALLEKVKMEEDKKSTEDEDVQAEKNIEHGKLHSDKISVLSFAGSWVSGSVVTTKF